MELSHGAFTCIYIPSMRLSFSILANYFEMPAPDAIPSQNVDTCIVSWTPVAVIELESSSGKHGTWSDIMTVMLFCVPVVLLRGRC
jgi:hypothetical protein